MDPSKDGDRRPEVGLDPNVAALDSYALVMLDETLMHPSGDHRVGRDLAGPEVVPSLHFLEDVVSSLKVIGLGRGDRQRAQSRLRTQHGGRQRCSGDVPDHEALDSEETVRWPVCGWHESLSVQAFLGAGRPR